MTPFSNFFDFLENRANELPDRVALSFYKSDTWTLLTFKEVLTHSVDAAARLQTAGLKKGDRIALLSESSSDWVLGFLAAELAGATVIPLDSKLEKQELSHIFSHSEPQVILTSAKFKTWARDLRLLNSRPAKVIQLEDLLCLDTQSERPEFKRIAMNGEDTALICYTSGTSGNPKGVMIPLRAILFEAESMFESSRGVSPEDVMLSVLPLNHLFGLTIGLLFSLRCGMEFCIAHDLSPDGLRFCLKSRKPTHFQLVPLVLKLLMRGIVQKASESIGEEALRNYLKLSKFLKYNILKRKLFHKIHSQFGGRLKRFICGGADLDPSLFDFFSAIGTPIYNGYGLTETGPVITTNILLYNRRGTVGRAIPGVEVQSRDGEILTRGPHIMLGYYKNPELTAEVLDGDGWFHTGDLGSIDKQGYLHLSGRKKNLIVLSSGKKVHPEEVEAVLSRAQNIKHLCVVGLPSQNNDGDQIMVVVHAEPLTATSAREQSEMQIKANLEELARELAQYKRPHHIVFRSEPLPMTASLKVKRHLILDELRGFETSQVSRR